MNAYFFVITMAKFNYRSINMLKKIKIEQTTFLYILVYGEDNATYGLWHKTNIIQYYHIITIYRWLWFNDLHLCWYHRVLLNDTIWKYWKQWKYIYIVCNISLKCEGGYTHGPVQTAYPWRSDLSKMCCWQGKSTKKTTATTTFPFL